MIEPTSKPVVGVFVTSHGVVKIYAGPGADLEQLSIDGDVVRLGDRQATEEELARGWIDLEAWTRPIIQVSDPERPSTVYDLEEYADARDARAKAARASVLAAHRGDEGEHHGWDLYDVVLQCSLFGVELGAGLRAEVRRLPDRLTPLVVVCGPNAADLDRVFDRDWAWDTLRPGRPRATAKVIGRLARRLRPDADVDFVAVAVELGDWQSWL